MRKPFIYGSIRPASDTDHHLTRRLAEGQIARFVVTSGDSTPHPGRPVLSLHVVDQTRAAKVQALQLIRSRMFGSKAVH